ncbi:MAG TPA: hypothetical protein VKA94_13455 [Hyphomicrobiales bacterium]|nr:hypothetical protein [Hyphomicrobiales bacterium]
MDFRGLFHDGYIVGRGDLCGSVGLNILVRGGRGGVLSHRGWGASQKKSCAKSETDD